jgi:hypothetical protein
MKVHWAISALFVLFIIILHINIWVIPHSILVRHLVLNTFVVYAIYELCKKPKIKP